MEDVHGEAKTSHGLTRAIRRGLANMKIQAYITAAAISLKRLAAIIPTLLSLLAAVLIDPVACTRRRAGGRSAPALARNGFLNSPGHPDLTTPSRVLQTRGTCDGEHDVSIVGPGSSPYAAPVSGGSGMIGGH